VSARGYQLFWDDYSDLLQKPSELIPVRNPARYLSQAIHP